jgi:hypothetical protein
VHEIISEVRSLSTRGAFDRQKSILQFIPNVPYRYTLAPALLAI